MERPNGNTYILLFGGSSDMDLVIRLCFQWVIGVSIILFLISHFEGKGGRPLDVVIVDFCRHIRCVLVKGGR